MLVKTHPAHFSKPNFKKNTKTWNEQCTKKIRSSSKVYNLDQKVFGIKTKNFTEPPAIEPSVSKSAVLCSGRAFWKRRGTNPGATRQFWPSEAEVEIQEENSVFVRHFSTARNAAICPEFGLRLFLTQSREYFGDFSSAHSHADGLFPQGEKTQLGKCKITRKSSCWANTRIVN